MSADDATDLARLIREAKAYLDDTPVAFMRVISNSQAESEPGDRWLELAALCGLVEAAKDLVDRAHQIAGVLADDEPRRTVLS